MRAMVTTLGAVRCGAVRCGAVRCGAVRRGAVRCGAVRGRAGQVQARPVPSAVRWRAPARPGAQRGQGQRAGAGRRPARPGVQPSAARWGAAHRGPVRAKWVHGRPRTTVHPGDRSRRPRRSLLRRHDRTIRAEPGQPQGNATAMSEGEAMPGWLAPRNGDKSMPPRSGNLVRLHRAHAWDRDRDIRTPTHRCRQRARGEGRFASPTTRDVTLRTGSCSAFSEPSRRVPSRWVLEFGRLLATTDLVRDRRAFRDRRATNNGRSQSGVDRRPGAGASVSHPQASPRPPPAGQPPLRPPPASCTAQPLAGPAAHQPHAVQHRSSPAEDPTTTNAYDLANTRADLGINRNASR